ncbi:MAG: DUF5686 family protein [Bacteroidaceae bacterium]
MQQQRILIIIFTLFLGLFSSAQTIPDSFPPMKEQVLGDAGVKAKRTKYKRKENPAVALMKRVIAAKKASDLHENDFFRFEKYEKLTLAINEFTPKVFEDGHFKKMPFLKDHVEVANETGKLTLPISYNETISEHIYRKSTNTEKTIIKGQSSSGMNDLFNTGDIINSMLKECFTNVDIYQNNVRLLQYPFLSPIASSGAIRFYRYYLIDTLYVGKDRCIEVGFSPNNQQDFGFTGSLFITADSSYRVRKVSLRIPKRSDVNFVEDLQVEQEFYTLPSGKQTLLYDEMLVQLKVAKFLGKFQVRRSTHYRNYNFSNIPEKQFKIRGIEYTEPNAMMRNLSYWDQHRPVPLTKAENKMPLFVKEIQNVKHFKEFMFVLKAFVENFVETSTDPKKPSKVDLGPVNTSISQNYIDGLRLRLSAQTTANLNPHLFARGYAAYGFKDNRWKGLGEVTYSFNEKAYLPREFPVNNVTLTYQNDVISPSDKFLPTDKDNVFTSFKVTTVDQMMYTENIKLKYEVEWENGIRVNAQIQHTKDEPTGKLFFKRLSTTIPIKENFEKTISTTDATFGIYYRPGTNYINTKQRRIATNNDSPIFTLSHTIGLNGVMGGDYTYNFTEVGFYKRFWLSSWGKIDMSLKGGAQWNKVPFPLLIMPAANLSYIMEDETFNLINNMEFLNDRYASLMLSWDLNGKIFNRIPLLKKLKWREYLGVNTLWGTLTNKNNPFLPENAGDSHLFYFPGYYQGNGSFEYSSRLMDKKRPYVELIAGVHNIFKILHVEYVRRLNYLSGPNVKKNGIRFMLRITF